MFLLVFACNSKKEPTIVPELKYPFILSADISKLPYIENKNIVFYNSNNIEEDMLTTLSQNGINTIRLRLWHTPETSESSLEQVVAFSNKIHNLGLKLWLSVHYSDTWADPGKQQIPFAWQNLTFGTLKDSVYEYTFKVASETQADIFQIGNEINPGFLLPQGDLYNNEIQFVELLKTASNAIRDYSESTKIMIHYAGLNGSSNFFDKIKSVDFDIIGLSYYPIWHGKSLNEVSNTVKSLSENYNKQIAIAETAYPFTLNWNDYTNNIVGLEEQLIPEFRPTPQGQFDFVSAIIDIVQTDSLGFGISYWGGEMVAFDGPTSQSGSPWENQALYDFNNKALPVLKAFSKTKSD